MNNVEKFFKDNLHNVTCRLNVGGIEIGGTIEQSVKLTYIKYQGLIVTVPLQYNSTKLIDNVNQLIIQNKENINITYDQRDALLKMLNPFLITSEVQVAQIYPYSVTKIDSVYDKKGNVNQVNITFKKENGDISVCNIYAIKPITE